MKKDWISVLCCFVQNDKGNEQWECSTQEDGEGEVEQCRDGNAHQDDHDDMVEDNSRLSFADGFSHGL